MLSVISGAKLFYGKKMLLQAFNIKRKADNLPRKDRMEHERLRLALVRGNLLRSVALCPPTTNLRANSIETRASYLVTTFLHIHLLPGIKSVSIQTILSAVMNEAVKNTPICVFRPKSPILFLPRSPHDWQALIIL